MSIGGNVGDVAVHLQAVVDAMRPWLVAVSPVYRTAAWGPIEQPDFLNAVLIVDDPAASPRDWLVRGQTLEVTAGRVHDVRWGPRTLDVDVITADDIDSDDPALTLPHPRAARRSFVLVPWLDIDPDAELHGQPVRALAEALDDLGDVCLAPNVVLR